MNETVLGGAKWAWDNRADILARLKVIHRWWKRSRVLLIGPGGTGKTTLARILAGEIDWLVDTPWDYSESYTTERLRMAKGLNAEMVVTPGQKDRRANNWPTVRQELSAGKYRGVVFVVANGHNALGENQLKQMFPGVSKADALSRYLAGNRADELAMLGPLAEAVAVAERRMWFLTVVTKQDLWHDDTVEVEADYRTGPFAARLRELAAARTAAFRHECEFVSLLINNLCDRQDAVVKKNTAGYDQRMQIESLRRLVRVIGEMIQWENER